jgi:tubulin polyglutamylase complex subunit 2
MLIEWKVNVDCDTTIEMGRIQVNRIENLTKVGSVLHRDFNEPSVFDLEELQLSMNDINSEEINKTDLKNRKTSLEEGRFIPHFDETSRNFELDNCNGFGKVCLVYPQSPSSSILCNF